MLDKMTTKRKIFEACNMLFLFILMIVTIYPILYVVFASFSDAERFIVYSGVLLRPIGFSTEAYSAALSHPMLIGSYINTLFVVIAGVSINILLTSIAAYFLSREGVLWQKPIAVAIIFTMYFSGGLVPLYFTVRGVGLYDSLWSLILPTAINTFNLMIMRTGFASIPISLEESARIDGAGHYTILYKIILPLAMPTVAVMILYYGVHHWNAWFHASIFLRSQSKYPLQLLLRQILMINDTSSMTSGVDSGTTFAVSETIKYAIIVIATLPVLAVYPFLQRYFVKGVMIGAVKG